MILLRPDQIAFWYKYSIERSGYREIYGFVRDFWKDLVRRGNRAIPPGFLARLLEIWMTVPAGDRNPQVHPPESETRYLQLIRNAAGSDRLDGVFIISGADRDTAKAPPIITQIIDRLPAFRHSSLVFSDSELEKSFSLEVSHSAGFNVEQALEQIYSQALQEFASIEFKFDTDDIFEIGHPQLFERAADRFFYRRMVAAMHGLGTWTRSVFTIKEESSWIVARYGEPQVLPLGGYDELTNKGTLSSIVTSELAYIDESMDFDLFDYKFIENQLMYFKRDSGAVFRIRRDVRVKICLTAFFEHERHLGLLFAWCFNFAEKLIDTFVKDMVNVFIDLDGFTPSSLADACSFFGHFLREKGLDSRICMTAGKSRTSTTMQLRENAQTWLFAPEPDENSLFVGLVLPQSDEFARTDENEQFKILGALINESIERMVKHAKGGWS
ncbi:MAG: hypothetical protein AB1403_02880 [Candidatus Riflebacteria bacterium]